MSCVEGVQVILTSQWNFPEIAKNIEVTVCQSRKISKTLEFNKYEQGDEDWLTRIVNKRLGDILAVSSKRKTDPGLLFFILNTLQRGDFIPLYSLLSSVVYAFHANQLNQNLTDKEVRGAWHWYLMCVGGRQTWHSGNSLD